MDIFLPRDEIVRQTRALLGQATSDVIATQVADQQVVTVQTAAREVALRCYWVTLRGEVTLDLGIEQEFINYPEDAGAGSVEAIGVWDEGQQFYIPLHEKVIPVQASNDQMVLQGQPALAIVTGMPTHFEQLKQIRTHPISDKAYKLRVRYQRPVQMPNPDSLSLVDAQAIIMLSVAMSLETLGDLQLADRWSARADRRIRDLRAHHQGNQDLQLNRNADMGEDEHLQVDRPRWDTRPTLRV